MKNPIVDVIDATYKYKNHDGNDSENGVTDLTFSIDEGEFVVLLGHNGSGKSTLAKLLNGFLVPSKGKVFIDGNDTADEKLCYVIRSDVGMVFQNPDNQTVASIIEDDVAFGPENLGVPPEEIRQRVDRALKTVGMYEYKDRTPYKLSGGQKQRVAIAAVLAMQPKILILDESTAMLDPEGRKEVLDTIKSLNKENGVTVILITHYMDEALDADKAFVLSRGKIIKRGTPKEVFSDAEAVKEAKLELPVATAVSEELRKAGFDIKPTLTDEELAEEICRLK